MSGQKQQKKSGGGRKIGRNKNSCAKYKMENRLEKNKAKTAKRQKKIEAGHKAKREAANG